MKPLLSILIPTVKGREKELNDLLAELSRQEYLRDDFLFEKDGAYFYGSRSILSDVEIIYCLDNKEMTIGDKRERLYAVASGKFSWQIDDDDLPGEKAISQIRAALQSKPDCVTFLERCEMNGRSLLARHSLEYEDWDDNKDGFDFVRTPFYKDVIRTDIARSVPFEHIRYGEDHAWSRALKPHLKTEVHIDDIIYIYQHNNVTQSHEQRYGISQP